ncbi:DUF4157 domain-containing protein [Hwanghaeella grinnelliae]|uniref:DUF4157 domain-containing protein n=1 Tax=Hwanghaeella grinnelliae TaxID=2500179 RepID=A0A3S2ZA61_9PROT|nr:DUF4157 domain-containing protein [Hwanghaeella grinnelliae]RVU39040.1 DUF4157 domain-containing protein [Hwanghaeella grinnelliae]
MRTYCLIGSVGSILLLFVFFQTVFLNLTPQANAATADGEQCTEGSDCNSNYCYPYPDGRRFCLNRDLNCAMPGLRGVRWGTNTHVNGLKWECRTGQGWVKTGLADGAKCQNSSECSSDYCYPNPDGSNYCLNRNLNCALPGSSGAKWGDRATVEGTTWTCAYGQGWRLANGSMCSVGADCEEGYCYPYIDNKRYCLAKKRNCATPKGEGKSWNTFDKRGREIFTCYKGKGWIQGFHVKFSEFGAGVGKHRDCHQPSCGGIDPSCPIKRLAKKASCEALRETEKLQAKPLQVAIEESLKSAQRSGTYDIPKYIKDKLAPFFPRGIMRIAKYAIGASGMLDVQKLAFKSKRQAIVLGNVIVFKNRQDAERNVGLWAHELEHVLQYDMLGIDGFAQRYVQPGLRGSYNSDRRTIEGAASARREVVCQLTDCQ